MLLTQQSISSGEFSTSSIPFHSHTPSNTQKKSSNFYATNSLHQPRSHIRRNSQPNFHNYSVQQLKNYFSRRNAEKAYKEVQEIYEQTKFLMQECTTKLAAMSNREIAKQITAFATDWVLTGKALTLCHSLCSRAGPLITEVLEVLRKESAIEYAIAGAEGTVHYTSEITKHVGGAAKEVVKDTGLAVELFSEPVVKSVLEKLSFDKNKMYHILTPDTGKHAWHKVCVDYKNWESVKEIITKVMIEGELIQRDAKIFEKVLSIGNEIVEVRFIRKNDGTLAIGSAWVKT
jgi:hypothetical protein